MDVDELQSVQSRERQTDSLQQLRESFYEEASEYIEQLRHARDDAAERADDPWNSPEVSQLSDEIDTAEQTVEAIYDRRTGKIVKKASLAAAGMPTEEDGLTAEERTLFESLVERIEANREHVLDKVAGELAPDSPPTGASGTAENETEPSDRPAPTSSESDQPADADPSPDIDRPSEPEQSPASESAPPDQPSDIPAADLMGDGESAEQPPDEESPAPPPPTEAPPAETDRPAAAEASTDGGATTENAAPEDAPTESGAGDAAPTDPAPSEGADSAPASEQAVERTTVRITDDVGPIYGVDDREYDLSRDDVVTLPEANVGPLLDSGAAEEF